MTGGATPTVFAAMCEQRSSRGAPFAPRASSGIVRSLSTACALSSEAGEPKAGQQPGMGEPQQTAKAGQAEAAQAKAGPQDAPKAGDGQPQPPPSRLLALPWIMETLFPPAVGHADLPGIPGLQYLPGPNGRGTLVSFPITRAPPIIAIIPCRSERA